MAHQSLRGARKSHWHLIMTLVTLYIGHLYLIIGSLYFRVILGSSCVLALAASIISALRHHCLVARRQAQRIGPHQDRAQGADDDKDCSGEFRLTQALQEPGGDNSGTRSKGVLEYEMPLVEQCGRDGKVRYTGAGIGFLHRCPQRKPS